MTELLPIGMLAMIFVLGAVMTYCVILLAVWVLRGAGVGYGLIPIILVVALVGQQSESNSLALLGGVFLAYGVYFYRYSKRWAGERRRNERYEKPTRSYRRPF